MWMRGKGWRDVYGGIMKEGCGMEGWRVSNGDGGVRDGKTQDGERGL